VPTLTLPVAQLNLLPAARACSYGSVNTGFPLSRCSAQGLACEFALQLTPPTLGWDGDGRLRLLVQNCSAGVCDANMTSRGSRSGLAQRTQLSATLNGQTLQSTTNSSRMFPSDVPSSWTDAFLAFEVPAAVLEASGARRRNVLRVVLDGQGFEAGERHGPHLVHMDLQLRARRVSDAPALLKKTDGVMARDVVQ
jgi:hypothetical protein